MMNDTVREELQSKVSAAPDAVRIESKELPPIDSIAPQVKLPAPEPKPAPPVMQAAPPPKALPQIAIPPVAPKPLTLRHTADLDIKNTSPTLVGFQSKNATLPDWRLQLQNSIRQRTNGSANAESKDENTYQKQLVTNGANALKAEFVEEPKVVGHANPRVANALKRIENSRRAFLPTETPAAAAPANTPAKPNYPFNVVSRSSEPSPKRAETSATPNTPPKPRLVSSLRIEKKGLDTNKLPPLPKPAKLSSSLERTDRSTKIDVKVFLDDPKPEPIPVEEITVANEVFEFENAETEEFDDLAPLAMRFNAGLFDAIIGGFSTLILLSPFMLSGGSWLSFSGFFAFAAAASIVMFLYLTISIAFFGRTIGMRIFSLEIVDAEENAYPTLHQAAVNSAVFILSTALGGVGFLPVFFNEERRAAHDLLSGTIMIREIL
jgi:uncharacterized RDD family membrane protein YckC